VPSVAIDAPNAAARFYLRQSEALVLIFSQSTMVLIRVTVFERIGVDPLFLDAMVTILDMLVLVLGWRRPGYGWRRRDASDAASAPGTPPLLSSTSSASSGPSLA
jgi:hypothetical protein